MTQVPIHGLDKLREAATMRIWKQPFRKAQEPTPLCSHHLSVQELKRDFSMADLNDIHHYLWLAGHHGHCEPLHYHRALLCTIIPFASARLHLVWFARVIYVTPIPECLLNAAYYTDIVCQDFDLYCAIIGFLQSYCSLIQFPIDLAIAQDLLLILKSISWDQWVTFRRTILTETISSPINKRYEYGELRLDRLDKIYRFAGRGLNYFAVHRQFRACFIEYFAIFAAIFAFIATILTAMQVIVGVDSSPGLLVSICYRFSIMVLIFICLVFGLIGSAFSSMFVYSFVRAGLVGRSKAQKLV